MENNDMDYLLNGLMEAAVNSALSKIAFRNGILIKEEYDSKILNNNLLIEQLKEKIKRN